MGIMDLKRMRIHKKSDYFLNLWNCYIIMVFNYFSQPMLPIWNKINKHGQNHQQLNKLLQTETTDTLLNIRLK